MDRREMLRVAGCVAGAGLLAQWPAAAPAAEPVRAPRPWRAKLGCQKGPMTDEAFRYFARHGVQGICGWLGAPALGQSWKAQELLALRERVEAAGVALDMVQLNYGATRFTMLGKSPEREREVETVVGCLHAAREAGIPAVKYNMDNLGVLRTDPTPGRGGSRYSSWDLNQGLQDPRLPQPEPATEDQLWERITWFLEQVIPVAAECRIRMACHPADPPVPPEGFRGLPRPLGTVEGLQRFVSIAENRYHGLNFCQGTISEMLADPGKEIFDVIRWFGSRRKILLVHFRNIRGRRDRFQEVYHDEGDVDMHQAMRVYREVGYPYLICPDHVPESDEDPGSLQGFAFAYGYVRGLMQAVAAET